MNAFTTAVQSLRVPIVDAALAYDCPYSHQTYLCVVRQGLYVSTMDHNLVPPFIMREAGLTVNDTAKQHREDPSIEDHSIFCPNTELRIPLRLDGIFSYFPTRALTQEEVENAQSFVDNNRVIYLSPDVPVWNPNVDHYAAKENSYLDGEGNMALTEEHQRPTLIEDAEVSSLYHKLPVCSTSALNEIVDRNCDSFPADVSVSSASTDYSCQHDPISAMIASVNPLLCEEEFDRRISDLEIDTATGIAAGAMVSDSSVDDGYIFEQVGSKLEVMAATISAVASGKQEEVTAENLSKIWRISYDDAERTLRNTTQFIQHDVHGTLARNFGTSDRALRYRRLKSIFFMDTLIIGQNCHSVRGYKFVQVFVSDRGFVYLYLMESLTEIPNALKMFSKEVGCPETLVADHHKNHKDRLVKSYCLEIGTKLRILEESTQWANYAERMIGMLKLGVRKDIREADAPMIFWCYAIERRAMIINLTAKNDFKLRGSNPYFATYGQEGDISNICHFGFFDWCFYRDNTNQFPQENERLGRCLGPAINQGNEMAQWILKHNGEIIVRRTLRKLTAHEESSTNDSIRWKKKQFMDRIRERFGDSTHLPNSRLPKSKRKKNSPKLDTIPEENELDENCHAPTLEELLSSGDDDEPKLIQGSPDGHTYDFYEDSTHGPLHMPHADLTDAKGKAFDSQSLTDNLINVEVLLPNGEEEKALATVIRKSVDDEGRLKGKHSNNPLFSTLTYDVQFKDGTVKEYQANIIAQNILQQVDPDGHYATTMTIVGHKMEPDAIGLNGRYIVTRNGDKVRRKTTRGWQLLVRWKDGTQQWIPLKDLKESNPVDVAEYAVSRNISHYPAFAWWVDYVIKKKRAIISSVKARTTKKSHKYGIEVPKSIEDAMRIDHETGTTYWKDALDKEMFEVGRAIDILDEGVAAPVGYTKSSGHLIFDIKMDLSRKARWVKDGHKTPDSTTSSYAGVVSRESVRIALTYAHLHGLDVCAADVKNAYLQAPSSEKHYIICGPEFGIEKQGRVGVIVRALYGGKVAGRDFWLYLRKAMEHLGFVASKGDADVWMRRARRHSRASVGDTDPSTDTGRGAEYWEYVLLYVDDVLVVSDNAQKIIRQEIGSIFELKQESIGKPDIYLGGQVTEVELPDGSTCWGYGSSKYVNSAVKNAEEYFVKKFGKQLPAKANTPISTNYRPEIDCTRELNPEEASYFHQQIGILRWIVELGRVDINTEVSMLSSCLAMPREGHLDQVFHIYAYLKRHHNAVMVFDSTAPDIDFTTHFPPQDWSYSTMSGEDRKEELPPNMPAPLGGKSFIIRAYVDSDHAGDSVTRRSRTGFIVYLNNAPIYWKSAKQASVETSTFGSEFVAMKQCCEYLRGLRYKLRMMGIPVEGPCYIFGDNQSVLANTTNPGSQLKKKSNAICYHFVREGCARNEWMTAYIKSEHNIADLLTKPLPSGEKRFYFVRMILQYIGMNE